MEHVLHLIDFLFTGNLSKNTILVLLLISIVFLIICVFIAKYLLKFASQLRGEVKKNETDQTGLRKEFELSEPRIKRLERDIEQLTSHVDFIASQQIKSNADVTERISTIKETIAGMSSLVEIVKQRIIRENEN
jgi:uncharacterized protein YlxW (UPF0749 family)